MSIPGNAAAWPRIASRWESSLTGPIQPGASVVAPLQRDRIRVTLALHLSGTQDFLPSQDLVQPTGRDLFTSWDDLFSAWDDFFTP